MYNSFMLGTEVPNLRHGDTDPNGRAAKRRRRQMFRDGANSARATFNARKPAAPIDEAAIKSLVEAFMSCEPSGGMVSLDGGKTWQEAGS